MGLCVETSKFLVLGWRAVVILHATFTTRADWRVRLVVSASSASLSFRLGGKCAGRVAPFFAHARTRGVTPRITKRGEMPQIDTVSNSLIDVRCNTV